MKLSEGQEVSDQQERNNMFKSLHLYTALVLGLLFLGSCNVQKNTTKVSGTTYPDTLSEEQRLNFEYAFFEANKYLMTGKSDLALAMYNQCLKIYPYSAVAHYELASIYVQNKEFSLAEMHIDKALAFSPDQIWYNYLAANIYALGEKYDKAIERFSLLIKKKPGEMDFYLGLAEVYISQREYKKAIEVYDEVDKNLGKSQAISLQKNKLYMALGDKNSAVKELNELYVFLGNDVHVKRILADFYIQTEDIDQAINTYNEILAVYPNDGYAYIGLAECYRLTQKPEEAIEALTHAFNDKEVPSDLKVNLILNLMQIAQNNAGLTSTIEKLIVVSYEQFPDNNDIKTLYVEYLLRYQKYQEARDILRSVLKDRKDKYALWEQTILIDNQLQNWDSCYALANEALKYFPSQNFLYFFKGFSAFQLKEYEKALQALEFGYRITSSTDELLPDFISFLAEVNYQLGHKEKAFEYFDNYLTKNSDNIMMLNNYAYYLSVDKIRLDEALTMSAKTVKAEPENSTYLDTYAWILFEMKNYQEALKYIEKAVQYDAEKSDVIVEHYGDILFFLGRLDEAISTWEKAKSIGEGSGLLDEKISKKQYLE